jgi:hypothetical protein
VLIAPVSMEVVIASLLSSFDFEYSKLQQTRAPPSDINKLTVSLL